MADRQDKSGVNRPGLSLHIPEPRFRPGDTADFTHLAIPPAGAQPG
jgi:2-oxoisovalerate dehydrogenase E1 component alpha subunit